MSDQTPPSSNIAPENTVRHQDVQLSYQIAYQIGSKESVDEFITVFEQYVEQNAALGEDISNPPPTNYEPETIVLNAENNRRILDGHGMSVRENVGETFGVYGPHSSGKRMEKGAAKSEVNPHKGEKLTARFTNPLDNEGAKLDPVIAADIHFVSLMEVTRRKAQSCAASTKKESSFTKKLSAAVTKARQLTITSSSRTILFSKANESMC